MINLNGATLKQGDSQSITHELEPTSIPNFASSGYRVKFVAKTRYNLTDTQAEIRKDVGNGIVINSAYQCVVGITPSDTRNLKVSIKGLTLYYEFQLSKLDGSEVYTTESGSFMIEPDIAINI